MRRFLTAAAVCALAVTSAPTTAQRANAITERDRATGAEQHKAILEEFGGAYNGPGTAMVNRVAKAVAIRSGIAQTGNECTVTLLDSAVVNAFALPGCYVYVTRGLLSIMSDEAELASVLGHEIGHVAARHSQKRQNRATISGIGSVLASVFLGQGAGQIANYVGTRQVLAFSRDQEFQADELGIKYMTAAGYDPFASPDMLESLEAETALQTKLRGKSEADLVPAWQRTHPLTSERIDKAVKEARKTGVQQGARTRNGASYLSAINGMLYGDNPREGVIDEQTFSHPGIKLRFQAPPNSSLTNGRTAVTITTTDGGQAQFSGGAFQRGEDLEGYVTRVARATLGQSNAQVGRFEPTRINGLDAMVLPARAQGQKGTVDVTIAAYRWGDGQAFHFVTIAPQGRRTFDGMIGSLRRMTDAEASAVRPRVVQVVTARPGDTAQSLSQRMAFSNYRLDRFLAINDRDPGQPIRPGEQLKVVAYGR